MCTPVGHSLAGAIVMRHSKFPFKWTDWKAVLGLLFISNLPDIDILFGWVKGNPNQYHQEWTHSLAFIVGMSLMSGVVFSVIQKEKILQFSLVVFCILAFHLICDMFGNDTRPPIGIPLFWPLSEMRVHSPVALFGSVQKSSDSSDFIASLVCWQNAWVVLREILVIGPFYFISNWNHKK